MRCVSWNVNGIRAVVNKGLEPWAQVPRATVVCLQEVKARPEQVPPEVASPEGWHAAWFPAKKPGYSGVASFSREQPDQVIEGLGVEEFDAEGRVVTLRFGSLCVVNAYFPNSQDGGKRLDYKLAFCAAMERFLAGQRKAGRQTVLLGDYNIAHQPIDLARPHENEQSAGYLPEERAWFTRYLTLGYRDLFRERNPTLVGAYSWWSYRSGARERNIGWRIDYATTSPDLADRAKLLSIHPEVDGSDHCPVSIDLT